MLELIPQLLMQYHLPALFAGAFLFGETVILAAAFLSTQGWWSITVVFWVTLLGTILSDCLWFALGAWLMNTPFFQRHKQKHERLIVLLDTKVGQRPYVALLFIKFLYGTRILTIFYLSLRKIKFWQFVVFDTLGTALWLVVLLGIGVLAGRGYTHTLAIFHHIGYGFSVLVVFFIIYRIMSVWISKKIMQK